MIKTQKIPQTTLASIWLHLVEEADRTNITVLGVYSSNGESTISPDHYNWDVVNKMIKIDFGVDEQIGYFIYEYEDGNDDVIINNNNDGEDDSIVTGAGGIIINNNNTWTCPTTTPSTGGTALSGATF